MNDTQMRLDPLRQTWTMFAPSRAAKPQFSAHWKTGDSISPFAAGKEHLTGHALWERKEDDQWRVRVVPNRAPVLGVEGDARRHADGFYDHMKGVGAHEIIVEAPDGETLESLPLPRIVEVIEAWKLRMLDLMRDPRMRAFFVIKDVGEPAGARFAHSISQLLATALVPASLGQRLGVALDFFERKRRSIFEDILEDEIRVGTRLVYENNGFASFCPYASRSPFEQMILPKRQCPDFHGISDQEMVQLADVIKTSLQRLSRALDRPAYNLMLFTAPTRTARHDHWNSIEQDFRWHIEIVPRLFHSTGFELATGCHLNTVLPETAADYLRKIEL